VTRRALFALLALEATAFDARAEPLVIATGDDEPGVARAKLAIDGRCSPFSRGCRYPPGQAMLNVFGLRGSETRVSGEHPKAGVTLSSASSAHLQDAELGVSGRLGHFAMLGGGRGGIEGGIGIDMAFGLYRAVAEAQGPFTRIGGRGELLGNDAFYSSMLELPQLQLGYGLLRPDLGFELAARAGPVLVGRYHPAGARRRLGGAFEWGALGSVELGPFELGLEWTRIEVRDRVSSKPFDVVRTLLCGMGSGSFGACFDTRLTAGDADRQGVHRMSTWYFGLTLGAVARDAQNLR
jgi:hypothetical protein